MELHAGHSPALGRCRKRLPVGGRRDGVSIDWRNVAVREVDLRALGNAVGFVDNIPAYDRRMAFALKASTGNLERQTAAILAKAAKLANLTPA